MEHQEQDQGAAALPGVGAPAPAPAGGAVALRLEKRTYLDSGQYRVVLRGYGDGLAEVGWSFVPALPSSKSGKGEPPDRAENEKRAVRRARSKLRQRILAAGADHMLTLTYRENVTEFRQACADLSRFVRIVKGVLPGWVYVGVPERQQRGAWHWHLAVRGRQDVDLLRQAWRRVIRDGNIDVKAPPAGGKRHRKLALVRYLSKYLGKGFELGERELNARRFRASLGIAIPTRAIHVPFAERGNVRALALAHLEKEAGSVGFVWDADDKLAGWACSWS